MMLQTNSKGLTLVETLAILVISSIVMLVIFIIVSSGINNSKQIQERANLQNEANYLLTVLREFHERGETYTISFNNGEMFIESAESTNRAVFKTYKYEVNGATEMLTVNPKGAEKSFTLELKLTSKKYIQIEHTTKTILQIL